MKKNIKNLGTIRTKEKEQPPAQLQQSDPFRPHCYLQKKGKLTLLFKKRYFVLKDGFLYYYKSHRDERPKKGFDLLLYSVKKGDQVNSFELTGKDHSMTVLCDNALQCANWILSIRDEINTLQKKVFEKSANELVSLSPFTV